jgi:predicted nucleotide-binding protein
MHLFQLHPDATADVRRMAKQGVRGEDIFIVHGHDGATKTAVARFLSRLIGREPIILHEKPDQGRTIIEKFEAHSSTVGCAVVLLTADDVGGPTGGVQQPRGRQNVVLELGFFLGKLGRSRVIILYEPSVELPSDLKGVLYIPLDEQSLWRNAVARELKAGTGLELDLTALLS